MDYTQSPQFVLDAGTGQNMHEENQATTTVWSDKDANSIIWSLMELVKAGGEAGVQFDEAVPATYKMLLKAIKSAFGGNVTTLNFANSPLVLTKDHAGLILVDGTAGNVSATLPAANVLTATALKFRFVRVDATTNTATINRAGADTFVGGATSFTLTGLADFKTIESDLASKWAATAQTATKQLLSITGTVAANALTLGVAASQLDFRSTPVTSGLTTTVSFGALSLVVPSGATLGTVNGVQSRLILLVLNNGGTGELAVVNISGGVNLDETGLISTTAISGASNSAGVAYSTTARASVPYRVVGAVDSTQAAAGTWATAPSALTAVGGQALAAMSSLGYGQTWQSVSGSRTIGTTYYNTTGRPIACAAVMGVGGTGGSIGMVVNGVTVASGYAISAAAGGMFCIVPPGASYAYTATGASSPSFLSAHELR